MNKNENSKNEQIDQFDFEKIEGIDPKVKALASEIRRAIISLLFVKGPLYNGDIAKKIGIKPSHLAYHLGMLEDAGYVRKNLGPERDGKQFALYSITNDGEEFLEFIGAKPKLEQLMSEKQRKLAVTRSQKHSPSEIRSVALYTEGKDASVVKKLMEAFRFEDINVVSLDLKPDQSQFVNAFETLELGREMRSVDAAVMMLDSDRIDYLKRDKITNTLMGFVAAAYKPCIWIMRDSKKNSKEEIEAFEQLHQKYGKMILLSLSNAELKNEQSYKTIVHKTKALMKLSS